jgi:hypothetical protein
MKWVLSLNESGLDFGGDVSLTTSDIVLKFSIADPASLWHAAAKRLQRNGLALDDVIDTIGSVDDPSIDDCLTTLMFPMQIDGCDLIEFSARSRPVTNM